MTYMLNKLRKRTDYKKLKLNLLITRIALENTANSRNSFNEIFEKVNKENYLWQITLNDRFCCKVLNLLSNKVE